MSTLAIISLGILATIVIVTCTALITGVQAEKYKAEQAEFLYGSSQDKHSYHAPIPKGDE